MKKNFQSASRRLWEGTHLFSVGSIAGPLIQTTVVRSLVLSASKPAFRAAG